MNQHLKDIIEDSSLVQKRLEGVSENYDKMIENNKNITQIIKEKDNIRCLFNFGEVLKTNQENM